MFILDLAELLLGDVLGFALVGDESPVRDAVVLVRSGYNVPLVDLVGPPPDCGHSVLDRSDRETPFLPLGHQGLDVLWFERSGLHLSVAQGMQLVGD